MIFYSVIYSILSLIGLLTRAQNARLGMAVALGFFLVIFMGGRFDVGCDFYGYLHRFNSIYWDQEISSILSREEPGFHLLNLLVINFNLDYVWLNLLASTIYLVCLFRFSRLSPYPFIFIACCFPILILQLGMSGLRQALALAFLMLAFVSYVDQKKITTFLWILLAGQFHQSAYVFLPLSLLAGKKFTFTRVILVLVLTLPLLTFLLQERVQVYSARYVEEIYGENSSSGAWIRYAIVFLTAVLFEIYRKRIIKAFVRTYEIMRIFSLISFALLPIGFISSVALHRLIYYLLPVTIMMLICVFIIIPTKKGVSRKLILFPLIIFGIYLFVWFSFSRHANSCYVPYQSYLFLN